MSTPGLYVPGRSVLHRMRPGPKLALLAVSMVAVVALDAPVPVVTALLAVVGGYLLAGVGLRVAWRQVRPVLLLALVVGGWQVVLAGPARAGVVAGQLVAAVALAGLVTVTTRTTDLLDALASALRPLRRLGVDPDRAALLPALAVRAVPVMVRLAGEVRDAQRARGLGASPRAYAVPLVVRALRRADALGEALAARGVDD